ncbi:MAG: glycosyltransferase [Gemmatimonadaceae bacterium]|nr:glycosyltransferase [Gemmatimonadaceae bacterium]
MIAPHTLSVVIPTYERPETLQACLDALGREPFARDGVVEVIVTDDSRSERTKLLIANAYPWVRWRAGPRRGPAANRNAGARAARGAWVLFVDDDCVPVADFLSTWVAAIGPEVEMYEGAIHCADGVRSPMMWSPINPTGGCFWSANVCYRGDCFEWLGGFDERFPFAHMEDTEFRERFRRAGLRERFVAEAAVDHPPRRLKFGAAYAAMLESEVLYRFLHGDRDAVTRRVWRGQLRGQLVRIWRYPWQRDSLVALASIVAQAWWLRGRAKLWEARWRTVRSIVPHGPSPTG